MKNLLTGKTILWIAPVALSALAVLVLLFTWGNDPAGTAVPGISWQVKEGDPGTRDHTVPILLYHNIDGRGPFSLSNDTLRKHFETFREMSVKIISLKEFIGKMEKPGPFEKKVIALSFDDGFYSMYSRLLPLTREFGYPVTLFVYTDNIHRRATKSLTWENLKELEAGGISVECHTQGHPDLAKMYAAGTPESRRRLFEEIYLSKRIIELYMGKPVRYFAFPYGRYNLPLIRLCELAGYTRVFSTDYGPNIVTRNNYCIRRQHIKSGYSLDKIKSLIQ